MGHQIKRGLPADHGKLHEKIEKKKNILKIYKGSKKIVKFVDLKINELQKGFNVITNEKRIKRIDNL